MAAPLEMPLRTGGHASLQPPSPPPPPPPWQAARGTAPQRKHPPVSPQPPTGRRGRRGRKGRRQRRPYRPALGRRRAAVAAVPQAMAEGHPQRLGGFELPQLPPRGQGAPPPQRRHLCMRRGNGGDDGGKAVAVGGGGPRGHDRRVRRVAGGVYGRLPAGAVGQGAQRGAVSRLGGLPFLPGRRLAARRPRLGRPRHRRPCGRRCCLDHSPRRRRRLCRRSSGGNRRSRRCCRRRHRRRRRGPALRGGPRRGRWGHPRGSCKRARPGGGRCNGGRVGTHAGCPDGGGPATLCRLGQHRSPRMAVLWPLEGYTAAGCCRRCCGGGGDGGCGGGGGGSGCGGCRCHRGGCRCRRCASCRKTDVHRRGGRATTGRSGWATAAAARCAYMCACCAWKHSKGGGRRGGRGLHTGVLEHAVALDGGGHRRRLFRIP
ncbi:hypothetical protein I4F81_005908 [Pyropia yezoensis]|uniref:Uncharacterized protein n=1 Tax=Pyropia yezoensis TaxID=2788 RepID=A0ACC3BZS9_PYRYE|nr:hypothetical protein I4F81_005908 [Neopyropia yezoensis]